MKAVKITMAGRELLLMYTGEAMFRLQEEFGDVNELMAAIAPNTREGFDALCAACAVLAEQGELARRYLGYIPGHILSAEEIRHLMMPKDVVAFKQALPQAVSLGYDREIEPQNNEIDLGLAELDQKKTT